MDLSLDPQTTALITIDLQRGIVGRQLAPHSAAEVLKNAALLSKAFRDKGAPVIYVHVLVTEILPRTVDAPSPISGNLPPDASDLVPESGIQPGDLIVTKRQWGAFYGTGLDQQLRRRGIRTIVLGGIATNFGVESTARDAFDRGYELVFAEDATSTMSEEFHNFSVKNLFPRMGRVRSSRQIIDALA